MGQRNDRAQWTSDAAERGETQGDGLVDRIAEALKRLSDILFPVPDRALQPVPLRNRVRR